MGEKKVVQRISNKEFSNFQFRDTDERGKCYATL